MKNEVDMQVLDILGPKTEADQEKPAKQKVRLRDLLNQACISIRFSCDYAKQKVRLRDLLNQACISIRFSCDYAVFMTYFYMCVAQNDK